MNAPIVVEICDFPRMGTFVGKVRGNTFPARAVLKAHGLVWQAPRTWHDDPAKHVGYWYSHVDRPLVHPTTLCRALDDAGITYKAVVT